MSEKTPEEQAPESADPSGPSDPSEESGRTDEPDLPDDLRPDEDNPLARHPEETGDDADVIGDPDGEPESAPLTAEDAEYGDGS